jgi:hypothetical protein
VLNAQNIFNNINTERRERGVLKRNYTIFYTYEETETKFAGSKVPTCHLFVILVKMCQIRHSVKKLRYGTRNRGENDSWRPSSGPKRELYVSEGSQVMSAKLEDRQRLVSERLNVVNIVPLCIGFK